MTESQFSSQGLRWGGAGIGRIPSKGKHDIPLHFVQGITPDQRRVGLSFTRISGSFELRKMAANAVRAGYQSPLDFRLLITLDPDGTNILAADLDSVPYNVENDVVTLHEKDFPDDPPVTVLGMLVYPQSDHAFRVMFQVRLRDYLTLPPLSFTGLPDNLQAEEPMDALTWVGLELDEFTPVPPDAEANTRGMLDATLGLDPDRESPAKRDFFNEPNLRIRPRNEQ